MANDSKIMFRDDGAIRIKGVRLSYPHLFEKWAGEEGQEKKYSARFLLSKKTHKAEIAALREHLEKFQKENGKGKKAAPRKWFFRDGDHEDETAEEVKGHWYIASSEKIRPNVINKDKSPLTEEDDVIYAGCFVNALINPWWQNNKFGIRINANLLAVQFVKDGERFSGVSRPDVDEAFDDEDDEGEEDDGMD